MRLSFFFIILLFVAGCHLSFAQAVNPEGSTISESAINKAKQVYIDFFIDQMQLYNGVKYNEVLRNTDIDRGHPFFLKEELIKGLIRYNNVTYNDVLLQYDIVTDQVITVLPNTNYKISLIKNHIQEFNLLGHRFVQISSDGIVSGFYEVLLDGQFKVFVKRRKSISESYYNNNLFIKRNYSERNDLYVLSNNTFYLIKGKKSLRPIFSQNMKAFNSASQNVSVSFKREKERYVVRLIEYYINLN